MSSQRCGGRLFVLTLILFLFPLRGQAPCSLAETPSKRKTEKSDADKPIVRIEHQEEMNGWSVAETANFRLFHQDTHDLAEAVLRTAERARTAQQAKWFGAVAADWTPKCRIVLYPSGQAYGEATGAPVHPGGGHTDITGEDGRVFSRCIHVHGTRSFLLKGVVPHEVTHAVLAGRLSRERVPRWADEGMAILAETQGHVDGHFRQLPRWRAEDALFTMRELIEMRDYPRPHAIGIFYAQSVALVDFLTREKDARCFAAFVRDGERDGYAASLRKHYGWTFQELDRRWQHHVFVGDKKEEAVTVGGGD